MELYSILAVCFLCLYNHCDFGLVRGDGAGQNITIN